MMINKINPEFLAEVIRLARKYGISEEAAMGMLTGGQAAAGANFLSGLQFHNVYTVECRDRHGSLKWVDEIVNTVVNVGLNDVLDKYFKGSTYTAAFYVGLTDGTPTVAAGDTMASHAGWAEITAYDEATRPSLTLGSVSSQSVDNSASKATLTISANGTTIGGAFVVSGNNTKGGSSGTLYGAGPFSAGDKSLDDDDTLSVTVTLTSASA